ncbi:MAG: hypothetical protein RID81_07250 [Sandaracinaceae bacterium]
MDRKTIADTLDTVRGFLEAGAGVLPPPFDSVARVLATAAKVGAYLASEGRSTDEIIAQLEHAARLDLDAGDAAIDALVAAKPSREG